jgi:hypothetical protein
MSAVHRSKGMAAICAITFALLASPAHSQEAQPTHMPTIADCPRGYVLAVQDTAEPFMPASIPDPNAGYAQNNQAAVAQAQMQAAAPRQFITGCVPRQPVQQQQYGGYQ